jgi:hypothetical protein
MKRNFWIEKVIPIGIAILIVVVLVKNLMDPTSTIGWEYERTSLFNKVLGGVFLSMVPLIFITGDRWHVVKNNHNFDLMIKLLMVAISLVLFFFASVGWSYDHLHNPYL